MGLQRNRLEATPRTIEPMLAGQMLFGGAGTSIGWLLVAFGSIFGWIFAAHADLTGWRFRPSAIATVAGVAEECNDTGYAIAGMRRGVRRIRLLRDGVPAAGLVTAKVATGTQILGRMVYKITLDFTARDGSTHTATVKTNEPERLEDEEQECILYLPSDPD